jgi:hypothetical protein
MIHTTGGTALTLVKAEKYMVFKMAGHNFLISILKATTGYVFSDPIKPLRFLIV